MISDHIIHIKYNLYIIFVIGPFVQIYVEINLCLKILNHNNNHIRENILPNLRFFDNDKHY
jgi:hypothetical protein